MKVTNGSFSDRQGGDLDRRARPLGSGSGAAKLGWCRPAPSPMGYITGSIRYPAALLAAASSALSKPAVRADARPQIARGPRRGCDPSDLAMRARLAR